MKFQQLAKVKEARLSCFKQNRQKLAENSKNPTDCLMLSIQKFRFKSEKAARAQSDLELTHTQGEWLIRPEWPFKFSD